MASEPEVGWRGENTAYHFKGIGLEAGPVEWLFSALAEQVAGMCRDADMRGV